MDLKLYKPPPLKFIFYKFDKIFLSDLYVQRIIFSKCLYISPTHNYILYMYLQYKMKILLLSDTRYSTISYTRVDTL